MPIRVTHTMGVDEAGRGPLAGPVAVGAVVVPLDFDWSLLPYVGDSKKVSPKRREATVKETVSLMKRGVLAYHVALVDAERIDAVGITVAVREGVTECFRVLDQDPWRVRVLLDGLLKAPESFHMQHTITGGDRTELAIGLASILAKVARDHFMVEAATQYPGYLFEEHKGYGTKNHWKMLRTLGPSPLHRHTFLRNLPTKFKKKHLPRK